MSDEYIPEGAAEIESGVVVEEEAVTENTALSGIAERPFCKGRAYDPNRYSKNSTEE